MANSDGLVVVDKPAGWTSHDVVGRVRRLAGTRKVGHAGTLDPMATGVLVLGVGRATRLLGHLAATDKTYEATIRLGQRTVTDDAEGELEAAVSAERIALDRVMTVLDSFRGEIQQVPSKVSAIKVDGQRSYQRVRAGETVVLEPRTVVISDLTAREHRRPTPELFDFDLSVTCSSGTYIRAIARDLGEVLGVGGHLTRLRRTRVGGFTLAAARTMEELDTELSITPLNEAVALAFPRLVIDDVAADAVRHGRPLPLDTLPVEALSLERLASAPLTGVFDSQGQVLALMAPRDAALRVVVGLTG